ncbi:MAG TPA: TolC family protein [Terriglobia bacterium]|nr:TolC family protein [Terriglobia bacterium]
MVKRLILYSGFFVLVLGLAGTLAQTPPPTLTLQQAETIALKNHPQVFAAQYNQLASDQVVREVRSAYYPTAYGSLTGSDADRDTRLGAGVLNAPRLFTREGDGITIDQLVYDSGRTPNLVASSRLSARAADENTQATRYDVLLAVNHAYFEVLRAQALLRVANETVAERQVVQSQVDVMVKNKLRSELDLSFANVNFAQAKLLQIQSQNNLDAAQAQLTRAMGLANRQAYTLQDVPLPPAPPSSSAPLLAAAMGNRPELAGLRFQQQSAYKYQRAQRDLSFPTVTAVGAAGYIPVIDQILRPSIIPDHYEAAGINVNIPIFNGHLFAADREEALMRARQANQNLRDMVERIDRDVRVAYYDAVTGYQRIGVTEQLLNQAKLALALAQGRYNLQLSSIVALSQAQLGETQAEVQAVNAKYDFENENAVLEYQTGMLR